jgi:hypothetical protein
MDDLCEFLDPSGKPWQFRAPLAAIRRAENRTGQNARKAVRMAVSAGQNIPRDPRNLTAQASAAVAHLEDALCDTWENALVWVQELAHAKPGRRPTTQQLENEVSQALLDQLANVAMWALLSGFIPPATGNEGKACAAADPDPAAATSRGATSTGCLAAPASDPPTSKI